MVDYARLNGVATRLIQKNGREVTVVKTADGSPADAARPWNPGARAMTEYATTGVFYPVNEKFVDGTTVRSTDEEALIALDTSAAGAAMPDDLELTSKDLVLDGAHTCAVVKSMPISPGPTGVVLHCVVRRGP